MTVAVLENVLMGYVLELPMDLWFLKTRCLFFAAFYASAGYHVFRVAYQAYYFFWLPHILMSALFMVAWFACYLLLVHRFSVFYA